MLFPSIGIFLLVEIFSHERPVSNTQRTPSASFIITDLLVSSGTQWIWKTSSNCSICLSVICGNTSFKYVTGFNTTSPLLPKEIFCLSVTEFVFVNLSNEFDLHLNARLLSILLAWRCIVLYCIVLTAFYLHNLFLSILLCNYKNYNNREKYKLLFLLVKFTKLNKITFFDTRTSIWRNIADICPLPNTIIFYNLYFKIELLPWADTYKILFEIYMQ